MVIKWLSSGHQKTTVQNITFLTATLSKSKNHCPEHRNFNSHFSICIFAGFAGFAGICGNFAGIEQKTTAPDIDFLQPQRGYIKKPLSGTSLFYKQPL